MSATEIGQISTALFLTYYAGRGHRPRWIAFGKMSINTSAMTVFDNLLFFFFHIRSPPFVRSCVIYTHTQA